MRRFLSILFLSLFLSVSSFGAEVAYIVTAHYAAGENFSLSIADTDIPYDIWSTDTTITATFRVSYLQSYQYPRTYVVGVPTATRVAQPYDSFTANGPFRITAEWADVPYDLPFGSPEGEDFYSGESFTVVDNVRNVVYCHIWCGIEPPSHIVRYQVRNDSPDPVAIAINMEWGDGVEEILTSHIEFTTETEAAATTVHPWIDQSPRIPISCTVRAYQEGEIVAESDQIYFQTDMVNNYFSELHTVIYSPPPTPKLNLSCVVQNGLSTGGYLYADINTSSGFQTVQMPNLISGGSYYAPWVGTFVKVIELAEGEYPISVSYRFMNGSVEVASVSAPISNPSDLMEYWASATINESGEPDIENPNPDPDPDNPPPPDDGDPNPNPEVPDAPPPPEGADPNDPNPNPVDYEKMAQAMETALNNQKVSGVNDSVQNLTDVVKGLADSDSTSDFGNTGSFGDWTTSTNVSGSDLGLLSVHDAASSSADSATSSGDSFLRNMFSFEVPAIPSSSSLSIDFPDIGSYVIPAVNIDLAGSGIEFFRKVEVFAVGVLVLFACAYIIKSAVS